MMQATRMWEFSPAESVLRKQFGSKRGGTVWIAADGRGEAEQIVRDMYTQAGLTPPSRIHVGESQLVKQALRAVY